MDVLVSQDDALEALQFQFLAISHEIQRTPSDVESDEKEFVTEALASEKCLDECKKKMRCGRTKSGILGQVGDQRFDPCHLLNKQMGALMEEKHGYATALSLLISELLSEHQNVLDYVKGFRSNVISWIRRFEQRQQVQCCRG